jgi:hypothetical protein
MGMTYLFPIPNRLGGRGAVGAERMVAGNGTAEGKIVTVGQDAGAARASAEPVIPEHIEGSKHGRCRRRRGRCCRCPGRR